MKKEWYKSSWIKGILIGFTQVIAVILIISMVWIISCPRAAANVLKGDNVQYEDTQGFAETFLNQYADILAGLEAKEQFETDGEFDGDKIVDIQNVSNSQPIDGKNEHGLAYRLSDLIDWGKKIYDGDINSDQYGSSGENEILVCKKPDSTYEYFYFSDFKSKIDSGELKFINETEDNSSSSILQELQDGEYYEENRDSKLTVVDQDNAVQYVDCWDYDGTWLEETCSPIDAENVLDIVNHNPDWNGKLDQAFSQIWNVLSIINVEKQAYDSMLSGYEENSSNVTYLYADRDKKTIYTNRKEYADFDNLDDSVKKIGMLDKYVLIGARASQFKGNVKGVLYNDCNYHNRLVTDPQDFVFVMGVDTKYPVQDAFYYESHSYSYYQAGIGVALAGAILSGILLMVCIIWLTIVVGRKPEDTELYLIGFDKLPTEVGAIIVVGLWGIFAAIMLNVADYLSNIVWSDEITYLGWSPGASVPMLLGIGILGFGTCAFFLFGYLSLIRRIKARSLWKRSVLRWLGIHAYAFFRMILAVGRQCLIMIAFIITQFLWASGYGMFLLIAIAADVAAFIYVVSQAAGRKQIVKGIHRIAEGQVDYKIPLKGMKGEQKDIAESINRIGDGLDAAVEAGMKNERLKTDLITNVSHDIKTPLTSIINYIDLMKRENIQDPKIQSYLEVLETKAQRLKTLTEDVVEASKVSSGNVVLNCMKLNLTEMIQQTSGEFAEKFEKRDLKEILNLPEEPAYVWADGRRTWRILENIYNNAAKYALEGSRIYADLKLTGTEVVFSLKNVSEQPLNISADELTERFIRGDVSRSTEGSGLGLSIARDLAKLMNAKFELYLDGDLFRVTITFARIND